MYILCMHRRVWKSRKAKDGEIRVENMKAMLSRAKDRNERNGLVIEAADNALKARDVDCIKELLPALVEVRGTAKDHGQLAIVAALLDKGEQMIAGWKEELEERQRRTNINVLVAGGSILVASMIVAAAKYSEMVQENWKSWVAGALVVIGIGIVVEKWERRKGSKKEEIQ
jgi:hypothetical protein